MNETTIDCYETKDTFEASAYASLGFEVLKYIRVEGEKRVFVYFRFLKDGLPIDEYRGDTLTVSPLKFKEAYIQLKTKVNRLIDLKEVSDGKDQ